MAGASGTGHIWRSIVFGRVGRGRALRLVGRGILPILGFVGSVGFAVASATVCYFGGSDIFGAGSEHTGILGEDFVGTALPGAFAEYVDYVLGEDYLAVYEHLGELVVALGVLAQDVFGAFVLPRRR